MFRSYGSSSPVGKFTVAKATSSSSLSSFGPSHLSPMGSLFWTQSSSFVTKTPTLLSTTRGRETTTVIQMLNNLKAEVEEIRSTTTKILQHLSPSSVSKTKTPLALTTGAPTKQTTKSSLVRTSAGKKKPKTSRKSRAVKLSKLEIRSKQQVALLKRAYKAVKKKLARKFGSDINPTASQLRKHFTKLSGFSDSTFWKTYEKVDKKELKLSRHVKEKRKIEKPAAKAKKLLIKKIQKAKKPRKAVKPVSPPIETEQKSLEAPRPVGPKSPLIQDAFRIALSKKAKGEKPTAREVQQVMIERMKLENEKLRDEAANKKKVAVVEKKESKPPATAQKEKKKKALLRAPLKSVAPSQSKQKKQLLPPPAHKKTTPTPTTSSSSGLKKKTSSSKGSSTTSSSKFSPPAATKVSPQGSGQHQQPPPSSSEITPQQRVAIKDAYQIALKNMPSGQLPTAKDVQAVMEQQRQQQQQQQS